MENKGIVLKEKIKVASQVSKDKKSKELLPSKMLK